MLTTLHLIYEQEAAKLLGIPDNVLQVALLPVASIVPGHAAAIPSMPEGVAWGETSRALLETFGARATVLTRPIDGKPERLRFALEAK